MKAKKVCVKKNASGKYNVMVFGRVNARNLTKYKAYKLAKQRRRQSSGMY